MIFQIILILYLFSSLSRCQAFLVDSGWTPTKQQLNSTKSVTYHGIHEIYNNEFYTETKRFNRWEKKNHIMLEDDNRLYVISTAYINRSKPSSNIEMGDEILLIDNETAINLSKSIYIRIEGDILRDMWPIKRTW